MPQSIKLYTQDQKLFATKFEQFIDVASPFILDIRRPLSQSREVFRTQFSITFLENYDWTVYNADGFKNILALTAKDGFILINGCPRMREYRAQLDELNLHYIEFSCDKRSDGGCSSVLVPRDQALSIEEVNQGIRENQPLMTYLEGLSQFTYLPSKFCFSTIKAASMPAIGASRDETLTRLEQHNLRLHKKNLLVSDLYQSIQALFAFKPPAVKNVCLQLLGKADGFFKYSSESVSIDLKQFKEKFSLFLTKRKESLTSAGPRLFDLSGQAAVMEKIDAIAQALDKLQIGCEDTQEEIDEIALAAVLPRGQCSLL